MAHQAPVPGILQASPGHHQKAFTQASGSPHPQIPPAGHGHPNILCPSPTHPSSLLPVQVPSGSKRELWQKASEQAKKAGPKLQARKRQQAWTTAAGTMYLGKAKWRLSAHILVHCRTERRNTCLRILPRERYSLYSSYPTCEQHLRVYHSLLHTFFNWPPGQLLCSPPNFPGYFPSLLACPFIHSFTNYLYESESRSVVSDSLQLHRLYRPWNPPGQNTGVGGCSIL